MFDLFRNNIVPFNFFTQGTQYGCLGDSGRRGAHSLHRLAIISWLCAVHTREVQKGRVKTLKTTLWVLCYCIQQECTWAFTH